MLGIVRTWGDRQKQSGRMCGTFLEVLSILPKREVQTVKMALHFPKHCNGPELVAIFTG